MTSTKTKSSFKFLPRAIHLSKGSDQNKMILNKLRAKGLYLKSLFHYSEQQSLYRSFKLKKIFKTAKSLNIPLPRGEAIEALKSSKRLNKFTTRCFLGKNNAIPSIKRLPRSINKVDLWVGNGSTLDKNQDYVKTISSIRYFPLLKFYSRSSSFHSPDSENHMTKELKAYQRISLRLRKLERICLHLGLSEQRNYQQAIRSRIESPVITDFKISPNLYKIQHHTELEELFGMVSYSKDDEDDFTNMNPEKQSIYENIVNEINQRDFLKDEADYIPIIQRDLPEGVDRDFVSYCYLLQETKLLYNFSSFPNLKTLTLTDNGFFGPVDSFIVEQLGSLEHLEEVSIRFEGRVIGLVYIFEGLLRLGRLRRFFFCMSSMRDEELELLREFLCNQHLLEEIDIQLSEIYDTQIPGLQSLLKELGNKKLLRSFGIFLGEVPLKEISKGLSELTLCCNQLERFSLEGNFKRIKDNIIDFTSQTKDVEGLCDFLKTQKDSLRELDLRHVYDLREAEIDEIAKTLPMLINLRSLSLSVNYQIRAERMESMNPRLGNSIMKLYYLEEFTLAFDVLDLKSTSWFLDVLKALSNLARLENLSLKTHSGSKLKVVEQKMIHALQRLENIRKINIENQKRIGDNDNDNDNDNDDDLESVLGNMNLEMAVRQIHKKQAVRCDFMF